MMAVDRHPKPTLGELLGEWLPSGRRQLATTPVVDIVSNSLEVTPGAVFFALPGGRSHGLDYAQDAQQRGAAVIVYEADAGGQVEPLVTVPMRWVSLICPTAWGRLPIAFLIPPMFLPRSSG